MIFYLPHHPLKFKKYTTISSQKKIEEKSTNKECLISLKPFFPKYIVKYNRMEEHLFFFFIIISIRTFNITLLQKMNSKFRKLTQERKGEKLSNINSSQPSI